MATELTKKLDLKLLVELGLQMGQSFTIILWIFLLPKSCSIVLNSVGLCDIIVVIVKGNSGITGSDFSRYINRGQAHIFLSVVCYQHPLYEPSVIAGLHFEELAPSTMYTVYLYFSLQWMKMVWTTKVFRMTDIPLRPQDTKWYSKHFV